MVRTEPLLQENVSLRACQNWQLRCLMVLLSAGFAVLVIPSLMPSHQPSITMAWQRMEGPRAQQPPRATGTLPFVQRAQVWQDMWPVRAHQFVKTAAGAQQAGASNGPLVSQTSKARLQTKTKASGAQQAGASNRPVVSQASKARLQTKTKASATVPLLQQFARGAQDSSQVRSPPGPPSVPMLGSLSFMWELLVQKVPFTEILRDLRAKYGPLFLIQTGPAKQVWVGDPDMLRRILGQLECCGRPATFEDPFGGFLFFTADPEKAMVSREQQRAWLAANLQEAAIQPAVDDEVQRLWPSLDIAKPQPWPAEAIKTIFYAAITRALLGDDGLMSDQELTDWMAATKDFTEQSSRNVKGKKESQKRIDGAERIKEIVLGAMERAGRDDAHVALPVLVASTVGGTEHIPNLLHWTFLYFMREPARQEAAAQAAIRGDSKELLKEIYAALRRMPYSGAIGPPRKIVEDVEAYDMLLPKGALVFAMHPAIVDEALGREPPDNDDFSSYVFGVGPRACMGKQISEALLPAVVGAILRRYRVEPADSAWYAKRLGEQRGQLNYPVNPPLLCWKRRDTDQSQRPSSEQQQQSQLQSVEREPAIAR